MNKLITGIGILFLSGMVSASAQMQYVDNDACQDDLSLSTPKFTREASPLDTLRKYILTPKAPDTPRINGAKVFGVRPGSQFLYTIPATGIRPMAFSVENLPKGLKVNTETGRITGSIQKAGEYIVTFIAKNSLGEAKRNFKIVVGDKIALTPPMGWNSWNCWGHAVSQEKVLSSAKAMVEKGLINHGWQYINIDDGWQGLRGGKYNGVMTNSKFPDMKGLADAVHAMGLKIGIYSGPWVGTYAGHIALIVITLMALMIGWKGTRMSIIVM